MASTVTDPITEVATTPMDPVRFLISVAELRLTWKRKSCSRYSRNSLLASRASETFWTRVCHRDTATAAMLLTNMVTTTRQPRTTISPAPSSAPR